MSNSEEITKNALELSAEGWEKRTTYDEPRLSEMVQLYQELGFEVLLQPFDPEKDPGCAECMRMKPELYKTLFTRKK